MQGANANKKKPIKKTGFNFPKEEEIKPDTYQARLLLHAPEQITKVVPSRLQEEK